MGVGGGGARGRVCSPQLLVACPLLCFLGYRHTPSRMPSTHLPLGALSPSGMDDGTLCACYDHWGRSCRGALGCTALVLRRLWPFPLVWRFCSKFPHAQQANISALWATGVSKSGVMKTFFTPNASLVSIAVTEGQPPQCVPGGHLDFRSLPTSPQPSSCLSCHQRLSPSGTSPSAPGPQTTLALAV